MEILLFGLVGLILLIIGITLYWASRGTKSKTKLRILKLRNAIYLSIVTLLIGYLIIRGGWLVYHGSLLKGSPVFLIGVCMCIGYRTPADSPTTIWLLTFLGKKTTIVVRRISYIIPGIIDKVEFSALKKDHNFQLKKAVRCSDGSYLLKEHNFISATVVADDTDDDPDKVHQPRTAGEKLFDLDDAGGVEKAITIMDDLFTMVIEKIANETRNPQGVKMTAKWMETHGHEIALDIRPRLLGLPVPSAHSLISASVTKDFNEQDDVRGTGITFTKFVPVFQRSPEVIKKANESDVETEEKGVEIIDTKTMNARVKLRIKEWKDITGTKDKVMNFQEVDKFRDQLIEETLLRRDKFIKVDNRGGANIVNVPNPTPTPTPTPAPSGGTI